MARRRVDGDIVVHPHFDRQPSRLDPLSQRVQAAMAHIAWIDQDSARRRGRVQLVQQKHFARQLHEPLQMPPRLSDEAAILLGRALPAQRQLQLAGERLQRGPEFVGDLRVESLSRVRRSLYAGEQIVQGRDQLHDLRIPGGSVYPDSGLTANTWDLSGGLARLGADSRDRHERSAHENPGAGRRGAGDEKAENG